MNLPTLALLSGPSVSCHPACSHTSARFVSKAIVLLFSTLTDANYAKIVREQQGLAPATALRSTLRTTATFLARISDALALVADPDQPLPGGKGTRSCRWLAEAGPKSCLSFAPGQRQKLVVAVS